jgi:CRISPR-associated exonuclease Cas4
MLKTELPDTIGLSYLNAFAYCPRRFYYEFVEGDMVVNDLVLEGTLQHHNADEPKIISDNEGNLEIRRLYLHSEKYHLSGFADVVEVQADLLIPVEYKHGKQGKWSNDEVQLCAQALCLEERLQEGQSVPYGFIFYFASRRRMKVEFTPDLKAKTVAIIQAAFETATLATPPPPLEGKLTARCRDCSLVPLCLPTEIKLLKSRKGAYFADPLPD